MVSPVNRVEGGIAYEARTLEQIETEFDNNIIFRTKNVGDLACNPSEFLVSNSVSP